MANRRRVEFTLQAGDVIELRSTWGGTRWLCRIHEVENNQPVLWDERCWPDPNITHMDARIVKPSKDYPWTYDVKKRDLADWITVDLTNGEVWPE